MQLSCSSTSHWQVVLGLQHYLKVHIVMTTVSLLSFACLTHTPPPPPPETRLHVDFQPPSLTTCTAFMVSSYWIESFARQASGAGIRRVRVCHYPGATISTGTRSLRSSFQHSRLGISGIGEKRTKTWALRRTVIPRQCWAQPLLRTGCQTHSTTWREAEDTASFHHICFQLTTRNWGKQKPCQNPQTDEGAHYWKKKSYSPISSSATPRPFPLSTVTTCRPLPGNFSIIFTTRNKHVAVYMKLNCASDTWRGNDTDTNWGKVLLEMAARKRNISHGWWWWWA